MTIDDLLDYDIDALVERTKNRPLPRGAISLGRLSLQNSVPDSHNLSIPDQVIHLNFAFRAQEKECIEVHSASFPNRPTTVTYS
jgi:hypothetical protein